MLQILIFMSGKGGSNSRPSAWEADALPLSYSRGKNKFTFNLYIFAKLKEKLREE
jgi:hypothetical protein